jgi:glucosamine 6-phosphate synthetase-like amidotransferase/phosphosugar isomerase protein
MPRDDRELRAIGDPFNRLLVASEQRGPFATGVALVNSGGDHYIYKAPISATQFVCSRDYQSVVDRLDQNTTLLMGHTRWPTQGSHLDNANNHPLVGDCLLTHNGHITNASALFHSMNLKRKAEVDSEILLRLAEKNLTKSDIDPIGLAEDIALCRGKLSAVIVATSDPTRILLVKGNQPLEVRCHRKRAIIIYASEPAILDAALSEESGWEKIRIPAWRLVVVDTGEMVPLVAYPIPRKWEWGAHPCP